MATKNEVLEYTKATVEMFFETNHVACKYCPLLETYSRDQCRKTGEYIINIHTIGYDCPLLFEEGGTNAIPQTDGIGD